MSNDFHRKNSHCSFCGHAFDPGAPWPRQCPHCDNWSFVNPIPVVVVLAPVGHGVLTVRRNIEPGLGKLALPGGYVDWGESWQEAGAREVREETGATVAPASLRVFDVFSAPDNTLIIFARAPALHPAQLPRFTPTREVSERVILTAPSEMAFPIHTQIVGHFFDELRSA